MSLMSDLRLIVQMWHTLCLYWQCVTRICHSIIYFNICECEHFHVISNYYIINENKKIK